MDEDEQRIEAARARNLAYLRRLDEKEAQRAADEFLKEHGRGQSGSAPNEHASRRKSAAAGSQNLKNTSVYVSGLTTYVACKQLETLCAKIGKVRRTKFYQDERGGLKGDALVTFASHNMMRKAVERLHHLEIKPGVLLTATEAEFSGAKEPTQGTDRKQEKHPVPVAVAERLFDAELLQAKGSPDVQSAAETQAPQEETATPELSFVPSRSVILHHVWDPLAPHDDAAQFFTELEDDMRQECGKHGRVEHVHILPTGAVMIRYETLTGAIQCRQRMHHRWFDGRQLEAQFDPSTPEEPEDDATKLDAFFASLE